MGLFGKLFEKKECAICGGEIGLLGNRKLEDGNMCKNCAAKLSPWFEDRRESTVEQINEQLAYREANKEKVAAFNTTRTLGRNTKVLLDEDAGVFVVTSARDLKEDNPDVLAFSDVTGCDLEIDEDEREITRPDKDGKQISYNPPRYKYSYDFYITIHVRNPYFDDIRFRLNSSSVEIEPPARPPVGRPMGPGGVRARAEMNRPDVAAAVGRRMGGRTYFDPERDVDYRNYKEMGEEIREALLCVRQQARDEKAAAEAPKAAVTCPYCGATTTPDAAGCCEYCGGAVNG
ncbi:MAG: DUF4428 domain-containing protein [Oscillibacter sp.]|nr:DUF4428 domain-containing protein [Oscillibacter sp.]